jgi:hypothetical protein
MKKDETLLRRILPYLESCADYDCGNCYEVADCPGCRGHKLVTAVRKRLGMKTIVDFRKELNEE